MLVHLGNSPTHRVVDRELRKVGRSKQYSALMREGLERSLTHASVRKDREREARWREGDGIMRNARRKGDGTSTTNPCPFSY